MKAILLAGGKGTRLKPYTTVLPKPLMPVGDYPIIEILIRQLKYHGISDITIALGHLGVLIETYCGKGEKWGVSLSYSYEEKPLGTAGPIKLLDNFTSTCLILNGDLLTDMDFSKMLEFHRQHAPLVTVGMFDQEEKLSLGVLKTDDEMNITDYIEKPTNLYKVSMGIYICEPTVLNFMNKNEYMDFPQLIKLLLAQKQKVVGFQCDSFWLDIGRINDYELAVNKFDEFKKFSLPFLN